MLFCRRSSSLRAKSSDIFCIETDSSPNVWALNIPHNSFSLQHHFASLFFPADPLSLSPTSPFRWLPTQQDAIWLVKPPFFVPFHLRLQLHPAGAGGHSKMDAGNGPWQYGGFLKWRYPNSWMVYKGESHLEMDDD